VPPIEVPTPAANNAKGGAGRPTQKEFFSLVADLGWAGVGNPDARIVDGEPGALLEHDRVAPLAMLRAEAHSCSDKEPHELLNAVRKQRDRD